jgi:Ser/Thr protein kinase RdoA (MazF antagonist)
MADTLTDFQPAFVHGDFSLWNVVISEEGDRPVPALIDLDFSLVGDPLLDVASLYLYPEAWPPSWPGFLKSLGIEKHDTKVLERLRMYVLGYFIWQAGYAHLIEPRKEIEPDMIAAYLDGVRMHLERYRIVRPEKLEEWLSVKANRQSGN